MMELALFLCMGGTAFFCVSKARSKRTAGWILAGWITGVLFSILIVLPIYWTARGFFLEIRQREGQPPTRGQKETLSQNVRGQAFDYLLRVPSDWNIRHGVKNFDVRVNLKSLFVGVIAEEANVGSPEIVADISHRTIKEVGTDIRFSDSTPLIIDGRNWLQFRADCQVAKVPVSYQFYVYSGREGTFQIVGWTTQNLFDRDALLMREVMQTFRFPN